MEELTQQEIEFLIDISEEKQRGYRYNGDNIETENTSVHSVDIYFLIQKLEKLK